MREQAEQPANGAAGHWVVERPAPGLARGQYAWPAWGIGALGLVTVLLGALYLVARWRQARSKQ